MTAPLSDRGNYFKAVISKESIPVMIQTLTHRIQGRIHIQPGERLKDGINQNEPFIAVTDAVIYELTGKEIYRSEFIIVNRSQVVWLLPEDQLSAK